MPEPLAVAVRLQRLRGLLGPSVSGNQPVLASVGQSLLASLPLDDVRVLLGDRYTGFGGVYYHQPVAASPCYYLHHLEKMQCSCLLP